MEGIIKVDPQQLITMAEEFGTGGNLISNLTNEMVSIVQNLGTTYIGDAATAYITKTTQLETDITKMNAMIQEHVTDLHAMANEYMNAETSAMQEAEALQTQVID